ncbi:unnamed protein product [Rotaria magnacalcarata]|uniref:6-phosphogluconate dehydrogenase NADP-binding domain-containing protein n=2 Tax=Rotaria magnacalcarata TaxID=392030 RepID=A0A816K4G6_9BILA|nr:unnamed protein product [Rotaria magnacalcarata]CAF1912396.1 unnamed protein product [Rotaria magnacalcarata]CAF4441415.1 unnamed protein product [Rotaria magnacalcarata]
MKISILGTGLMGAALTEGLINASHDVIVYNRTIAKTEPLSALGAKVAATPVEAITASDATIIMLSDGVALREMLLNDVTRVLLKGKKILNGSTTTYSEIVEIACVVAEYGGDLAEMTIMVSPDPLRNKQGRFMIGCKTIDESYWTEILLSIGESVNRLGDVGEASKAEAPMIFASIFIPVTVAYAAAVAAKMNMPQELSERYINMAIPTAEYVLPNMLARDYSKCMATVDSYASAVTTAIKTAESVGVPTKILKDIQDLFRSAAERGFAQKDGSSIFEVLFEPNANDK